MSSHDYIPKGWELFDHKTLDVWPDVYYFWESGPGRWALGSRKGAVADSAPSLSRIRPIKSPTTNFDKTILLGIGCLINCDGISAEYKLCLIRKLVKE